MAPAKSNDSNPGDKGFDYPGCLSVWEDPEIAIFLMNTRGDPGDFESQTMRFREPDVPQFNMISELFMTEMSLI